MPGLKNALFVAEFFRCVKSLVLYKNKNYLVTKSPEGGISPFLSQCIGIQNHIEFKWYGIYLLTVYSLFASAKLIWWNNYVVDQCVAKKNIYVI